jgi:hypothetical protein
MRCSRCKDHVPFWGERCPYCGREKTLLQGLRMLGAGLVFIGCVVGGWKAGIGGFFVGGITGGIFWASIEIVWNHLMKTSKKKQ